MLVRDEVGLGFCERTIIDKEFICVEGCINNLGCCHAENNPFGRNIFVPNFSLMKVHEGNPVEVYSTDYNHCHIYPVKDLDFKRLPARIWEDRVAYDATFFFLVPYSYKPDSGQKGLVKSFDIKGGFRDINGKEKDISLVHISHGMGIDSNQIKKYSFISSSQVVNHFYRWLLERDNVVSREKTFEQKDEGILSVPDEEARRVSLEIVAKILEERFGERLTFR